ncbi:MAG TPA: L-histidine N(alpha)-methyltransferase [Terriglobales bacterium]|nr:L-histidine N(alpha)-methyltransferase [Terriglobales bacterium]
MTALSREMVIPEIASEVYEGLTSQPKKLCPKLFYDAAGSALFEEITRLPEYYLTRTEEQILRTHADAIVAQAGDDLSLVELGAGSARKTSVLIGALLRRQREALYCPIDVSYDALQAASRRLRAGFPDLRVRPVVSDYTSDMEVLRQLPGRKLVLYIGSSIGNFEPEDALRVLRRMRARLGAGDALLLGTDLRKDATALIPAYDDAQGVTARFNKNVLARINRELGGEFDLDAFRHRIRWNPEASRIEMYLESLAAQSVWIRLLRHKVRFESGELLHTENSYKYTDEWVQEMLEESGFARENSWKDARSWFAVHLARVH